MNIQKIIICVLTIIIIIGIFWQYNYDASHCKQCMENMRCQKDIEYQEGMTNYIYDLLSNNSLSSL